VSIRWALLFLALLSLLTACIGDDNEDDAEPSGQITRPADLGLPLDNPASVEAFNVADSLLVAWFLQRDPERALSKVHPNIRESWRPLIEETEIQRTCSLLQVEGSQPDASGVVVARYAIGGCKVTAPGGFTAVYIRLMMTTSDGGPWVSQIEFLR
jgi:hypothetical protein